MKTINLNLDHAEQEQLAFIMRVLGLKTATELIRLLLRQRAAELGYKPKAEP